MAEALRLARRGLHTTAPNPRVGCVLSRQGRIIGQGWHRCAGEPHAEILALRDAGEARGATAYVSLEPCSHQGRTPPCTQALINAGIERVVAAAVDPNPAVAGTGLQQLENAGIRTDLGLMEADSRALNPGHFKRHETGRPWLRCKMAASLDGRTAMASGESKWITGTPARRDVQQWRARSCAILTGIGTVLADDPQLDLRQHELDVPDAETVARRQPIRVVLDSELRLPPAARLLEGSRVLVFTASGDVERSRALMAKHAEVIPVDEAAGGINLVEVLEELGRRGINELQVEAGPILCGRLFEQRLVDELLLYLAPTLMGSTARPLFALSIETMAQNLDLELYDQRMVGSDIRLILRPRYQPG